MTTLNTTNKSAIKRIYDARQIFLGAVFGGPLVITYTLYHNYKVFGLDSHARNTLLYGVAMVILICWGIILLPENKHIPFYGTSSAYAVVAILLTKRYQIQKIECHINSNGEVFKWWQWLVTVVASIVANAAIIFILSIAIIDSPLLITRTYGKLKHEVIFTRDNISETQADKIAQGFMDAGYFDDHAIKYVFGLKVDDKIELTLLHPKSVEITSEIRQAYTQMQTYLQSLFADEKIVFKIGLEGIDDDDIFMIIE